MLKYALNSHITNYESLKYKLKIIICVNKADHIEQIINITNRLLKNSILF